MYKMRNPKLMGQFLWKDEMWSKKDEKAQKVSKLD